MESKTALTTLSTSRWVRSGKSWHSFCTSSERIIASPRQIRHALRHRKAGLTLSGNPRPRKPMQCLLLLRRLLCRFLGLGFLQRLAEDVAERCARIGRTILRHRLLLFGDLHRLDREVRLL